jgi:ubiquinone/menaquinone biosynthesis C-methylase UbiE
VKYQYTWEEAVSWLKRQPDQAELVRACYFDDPLINAAKRFYSSTEWKTVQEILADKRGNSALDIGAGRGISSYALVMDGWKVTAVEPDRSDIVGSGAINKLFSQEQLSIEIVGEWGEKLPFNDNSFELVYARQVLHHAADLYKFCQEVFRVLKPGGMFLATREHVIDKESDLNIFLDSHPLHHLYGGENAYMLKQYKDAIKKSGLKIIKTLAPYDSDINLFPSSRDNIVANLARKYSTALPNTCYKIILLLNNIRNNTPGRLYSFITKKI